MLIGLTGGIGSGKSTILEYLKKQYNAVLIMADDVAKELMLPGTECYFKVVEAFGKEILNYVENDDTGLMSDIQSLQKILMHSDENDRYAINSEKLGRIVFNDPQKLKLLNSIVHPEVKKEILERIDNIYKTAPDALIILEAALLIEAGYEDICDELWSVISDRETRIKRLMSSRNYSRQKCADIMDDQLPDEEFIKHSDFVINNSGDFSETASQIDQRFRS